MLRYIGAICIFLFAFYVIFSYEKYQKRRILQGEAFLLLLKFLLEEMRGLGRPIEQCLKDFESEPLEECGFLPSLCKSCSAAESYRSVGARLCLPQGLSQILSSAFSRLGCASRGEEQRHLGAEIARAESVMQREREEQAGRLRLCRTLTAAGAMGLVILLL